MSYYQHDNAAKPGTQQVHTMYGDKVSATAPLNATQEGVGPATWSTAPYRPPKRRHRDNGNPLCGIEGCKGYPTTKSDYCIGHSRSLGLLPTCAKTDCGASPKRGSDYCRHHTPEVSADGDTV